MPGVTAHSPCPCAACIDDWVIHAQLRPRAIWVECAQCGAYHAVENPDAPLAICRLCRRRVRFRVHMRWTVGRV